MSLKTVLAVIDGITYDLVEEESGWYRAIVPAPKTDATDLVEYRSYGVCLKAEDLAGNITEKDKQDSDLGGSLRLVVKEKIKIETRVWTAADYWNTKDYNRIKYNVVFLKKIAEVLFESVESFDMGADKSFEEYPLVKEFRVIETNLNFIRTVSGLSAERFSPHVENGSFLNEVDLNRIEGTCRMLFDRLYGRMKARKRLAFRLGKRGTL